jgi:FLVCR family MFS transporter 7
MILLKEQDYKVYGYRWVVLTMYVLATMIIQLLWTTFFSITTSAWQYYGFSNAVEGEAALNMLSIIFMIGMIVMSVPSLIAFEKFGFKKSVGFGIVLTAVCGLLRGFWGHSYNLVLIVTIGFAIAQPFILNAVGMVAGKWFPESERATANGIGLLASYLGMAVGLLLTPVLFESGISIKGILMAYGIASFIVAILFVGFAKEKPKTPPCALEFSERSDFFEGVKSAFKRKNFIISFILFFCMLGVFNTFFTMIEPILNKLSSGAVNATGAGIIGVTVLGTGIVGSLILPLLSDRDKQHRRLPYMIVCNIIGAIGLSLFIITSGFTGMLVAGGLYGFFIVGAASIVLTFAAETAYPTSEGTSEGTLMFAGNIGGVIFLACAGLFQGNHLMVMIFMIAITIAYIVLMCTAKETKLQKNNNTNMKG